ncbi:synaptogyrin-4 isoform X1 [Monodelphis domestica]|uniref:synaptogyrin-4 isoform X1 n=2 Tax=Monodelphis domestica TaxID=13616 RepID=UPI00005ED6C3|nr:synaptogyrin-4 isoform X1 [Monodelphis domestica]XP_007506850.1 synaptogyrin-4 isoform X1 [Monodelphis domestica]XP_007506851.1 synaptogyrin-4 isoform X1 [Monodelphis domestica]
MYLPESLHILADSEMVQFVKRPKTLSRIFAGMFSLIVFATLLTDGYQNLPSSSQLHCVLNDNGVACSFAVAAGLLAFLLCLLFITLDALASRITSTRIKTTVLLLDFSLSVIWVGVWFVGFCFLANQWQHSPPRHYLLGSNSAKTAIAFSFFSIPTWMALAFLALRDLRSDSPIPYKRSLDEGGVALTTLSSGPTTTTIGPNSLGYPGSIPPPYPSTPKAARLAMMNDN